MSKLFWRYGAMGSGKTLALIGVAHNYERINQRAVIFTAAVDDRMGVGVVGSRIGIQRPARVFDDATSFDFAEIRDLVDGVSCVLVDEAQFLNRRQVVELHRLASLRNIPVICYGIRSDFRGEPFEGAAWLGALADVVEELRTVCECGSRASLNMRVDASGQRIRTGSQIGIGSDAMYRAKCPRCFYASEPAGAPPKDEPPTAMQASVHVSAEPARAADFDPCDTPADDDEDRPVQRNCA